MAYPPGPKLRVHVISDRRGVYAVTSDGDEASKAILKQMTDERYGGNWIEAVRNGARQTVALVALPGADQPEGDLREAALPVFRGDLEAARDTLASAVETLRRYAAADTPSMGSRIAVRGAADMIERSALASLDDILRTIPDPPPDGDPR